MSTTTRSSTPTTGAGAGRPAGTAAATGHFRYPGSLSFQDTELDRELFWGRREEALEVLHTILSSELTVLYGPSGIGKTSLLNAGVVQPLRARHYWPVSVRLNDPTKDPVVAIHEQIDEAAMRDTFVEVGVAPGCAEVADRSLWDLLTCLEVWRGNDLEELVLVLDQFEELFTLGWAPEQQARLAESLGDVLRGRQSSPEPGSETAASAGPPRVRLVIAIREDSLGHLETMAHDVPSIFDNRYRLRPLSVTGATAALVEPAAVDDDRLSSRPFQYSEDAVTGILTFLSSEAFSLSPGGDGVVDPSQLQLVCQHVERAVVPTLTPADPGGDVRVDLSDLGGQDGLASILGEFYRRTVDSLPERRQRNVRRLCEQGLVSQRGRRLSLEQGEIQHDYQVTADDLAQLVDRRLLRAEYRPRLHSHYYELAHDTLVEPILADRDARRLQSMRRRERLALAAAAVVAVVAVVTVLLWQFLAGPQARPLAVGDTLSGSLAPGEDPAAFNLDTSDEPTLVTVTPSIEGTTEPWNPVVEVAVLPDGTTTQHDRLGAGQAEQVVLVPTRDEQTRTRVTVTTVDGTTGAFDISREPVRPILLTGDGLPLDGAVSAPGETMLYVVDSGTTPLMDVEVTPIALGGSASPSEEADTAPGPASSPSLDQATGQQDSGTSIQPGGLELQVEIIGPDADRQTLEGQGQSVRTTVGGPEGEYYLVVRGSAASVGEFQITAAPLDAVLLVDGEPQDARLEPGSDALFAFTGRAGEVSAVRVTPEAGLDAMLELVLPDGRTQEYGSMPGDPVVAVVSGLGGVYQARVSAWDGGRGAFTIVVGTTSAQPLALGESVTASGLAVFDVEPPRGSDVYAVDVTPTLAETLVEVATVDRYQGGLMQQVESQGGETASVPVTADFAGTTRVVVLGTGPSEDYTVATREVDPTSLRVGETARESGLSVFTIPAPGDQVLVIEVAPEDARNSLQVTAYDANGFGQDGDFSLDGSPVRLPLSGGYEPVRFVVVSASRPGDYTAQIQQVDPRPIGVGDSVETSEPFSAFDVDVPPEQAATITVDSPMDAQVTVDGKPVEQSLGPDPDLALPVIGDSAPTRVLVRSWGPGEYTISVDPAELRSLDAADGLEVAGQITEPGGSAIYELLLPDPGPIAVTADSEDFEVVLALFGPEGDQYFFDTADQVQLGGFGPEGRHLLLVTGADDGTGSYQLTFASVEAEQGPVGPRVPVG